jgi:TatD DNase family protein
MILTDTHTHIFVGEFDADLDQVISRARKAGLGNMLLPNIDVESVSQVISACRRFPELKPMWGLHPCHVNSDWKTALEEIRPLFHEFPAVAVGEIGLDFYWSMEFAEEQRQALEIQLNWALEFGLPVSLHTRNATREVIGLVQPFAQKGLKGVFHCFSGTEEEAREIIGLGMNLGIGGALTYPKNPVREFIGKLPLESIVLETDAPYLPPVPYRGKRNEPAYLKEIVFALSDFFSLPPLTIAEITTANAVSVFNL